MLSDLHALALTAVQLPKRESIERRMLRSMVGGMKVQDKTSHNTNGCVSRVVAWNPELNFNGLGRAKAKTNGFACEVVLGGGTFHFTSCG